MRGSSAVEFAIIAPVLIVVLGGLADLAIALHRTIGLENAARAGAQHAMSFPDDAPGIAAATVAALGGTVGAVSVAAAHCVCPGTSGPSVSCDGTPCSGAAAGRYVSVSVTASAETIFGLAAIVLPSSFTGSAVARVR
ncbi:hypothetical protein STHU_21720 [Allostella humosa]|nr:hypothetical protein STHU_21720 [Stella humosa]